MELKSFYQKELLQINKYNSDPVMIEEKNITKIDFKSQFNFIFFKPEFSDPEQVIKVAEISGY